MSDFNVDRTEISRLLLPIFPTMAHASSDDWHAFLNHYTGLDVPIDEPNGSAFDKWRQALAAIGHEGVWRHTPAQIEAMKERGRQHAARAAAWRKQKGIPLPGDL